MCCMERGMAATMLRILAIHLCLSVICQGRPEMSHDCAVCGNVSISCSRNITAPKRVYNLFWNDQKVHEVDIENQSQFENIFSTGEVSKFIHSLDRGPYFEISQLNLSSSGVYVCQVCKIFPPPITCEENSTAVVFIEHTCPTVESTCTGGCESKSPSGDSNQPLSIHTHTPLLVALGLVTLYGLLLTPVTFKLWRTRKSQFEDHDYINMRPFGRRRYNGVQHPVHPGNRRGLSCNICIEVQEEGNHFTTGKLP